MNAQDWATLTGEGMVVSTVGGMPDQVGALGDGTSATVAHMAALDADIRHLNTDVNAQLQNPVTTTFITDQWAPFFVQWEGWFAENGTVPLLPIPGVNFNTNKNTEFAEFVQQYNEMLRQATASGVQTTAKRSTAADAPSWLKSVTSTLGTVGTIAVAGGLAYLAIQAYGMYEASKR